MKEKDSGEESIFEPKIEFQELRKIRFILKAYDSKRFDPLIKRIIATVDSTSVLWKGTFYNPKIVGPVPLPRKRRIYCVLRSPHVNKDSREQFEIRIHKRIVDIRYPNWKDLQRLKSAVGPGVPGVDIEIKYYRLVSKKGLKIFSWL